VRIGKRIHLYRYNIKGLKLEEGMHSRSPSLEMSLGKKKKATTFRVNHKILFILEMPTPFLN
jgi:hypothetical protein